MKISRAQTEPSVRRDQHYRGAGHSGKWKLSNGAAGWSPGASFECKVMHLRACFCTNVCFYTWVSQLAQPRRHDVVSPQIQQGWSAALRFNLWRSTCSTSVSFRCGVLSIITLFSWNGEDASKQSDNNTKNKHGCQNPFKINVVKKTHTLSIVQK